ncbi:Sugar kinase of the NBD/HSP70 family, may contain an N-terminal HTH domain [Lentibacillus persicus]|uniref:Sugar kinase of the NBD/HSP70 family, may contain an N-terminal HTH domain n=1 Tax=Lentibacillus persicus TaxID=640948 RepID=A0A1I1XWM0_9BACI|nr:ROK family protein [Lentibacillus persicus]SFE11671.1 Sugar kinase of the NBD/HSP70 family, may contain an N-terminal HTH domain [Lentibacillus persicus]
MYIAVFDIGGTSVKYGIATEKGDLLIEDAFPTNAQLGGETLVQTIIDKVKTLQRDWQLDGVAISSAGQIDNKTGIVVHATDTIPDYTGMNVVKRIGEAVALPVTVENDVNCTALGEHWNGAASDSDNFVCVTIGTGIGGALFAGGQLYTGSGFSAGEIGHMTLYPGGKACTCGDEGCLEKYSSSSALQEMLFEHLGVKMELRDFFDRLRDGDEDCVPLFNRWIDDLTTGLKSMVHMLNPGLIVIGGGISAQGDFLVNAIKASLQQKIMPNHGKNLDVRVAENGNQANLLGAVKHFLNERG